MKKVVLVQIFLLLCTVLLGLAFKTGLLPVSTDAHRLFGLASGLVGFLVLVLVFVKKQNFQIKLLAIAAVLLTFSAAMGGSSLATSSNYDFSYGQMAVSGILALFVSIFLFFKIRPGKKSLK